jgi:hypothetical protein
VCSVSEDAVDGLSEFMGDDVVCDELSPFALMAHEMPIETASDVRVAPHRIDGSLAEGPLEMVVALLCCLGPSVLMCRTEPLPAPNDSRS